MARRQTPPEWLALMDHVGISSLRELAVRADISTSATSRVVHSDSVPGDETVAALAAALHAPESTIYELTHGQGITPRTWSPPTEVQRLSRREQEALTEMIRAMAAGRVDTEKVGDHSERSAPIDELAQQREPDEPRTPTNDGFLAMGGETARDDQRQQRGEENQDPWSD